MKNNLFFAVVLAILFATSVFAQPLYMNKVSLVTDFVMGPNVSSHNWEVLPSYQMNIGTSEKDANVYATLRGRGTDVAVGAGVMMNIFDELRLSIGGIVDESKDLRGQLGLSAKYKRVTFDAVFDHRLSNVVAPNNLSKGYWYDARLMVHSKTGAHKMAIGLMARSFDGIGARGEVELFGGLYFTTHMLWDYEAPKNHQIKMGAGLMFRY